MHIIPLSFNQNVSNVAVTIDNKLTIYNINPFGKIFELQGQQLTNGLSKQDGILPLNFPNVNSGSILSNSASLYNDPRYLIEMLFATSLIAVVDKVTQPKKLKIINTRRKTTICELKFEHNVQQVCLNRKRLVVLLDSKQIFVYDISCMQLLHTIDVMENKVIKELVNKKQKKWLNRHINSKNSAISSEIEEDGPSYEIKMKLSHDDVSTLVYTSYSLNKINRHHQDTINTNGDDDNKLKDLVILNNIVVFDALNIKQINFIPNVHSRNVRCLALSHDGNVLSTASTRGTIIRCFRTSSGLHSFREFRRGSTSCKITQLEFDYNIDYLACVGSTDTIHIFQMREDNSQHLLAEERLNLQRTKYQRVSKYISSKIASHITQQSIPRNYAYIEKSSDTAFTIIGFPEDVLGQIYVCFGDKIEIYDLPELQGACTLSQCHSLVE
ncbi:related to Autophagy-related protein 21 [Saccharomycodes ludwigii]|uniref:Related to Autophagy-related protein 21 n=1 Tax=Saccharomycodes ludwigii TaxID=36035 RepID=A0A376BBS0_9ASCO|nr:hypothetical protein SCDLUD_002051 [Saccharomycodes ludwigii]KAH3902234.1 hypothetical protein SCDLUD_002051 [Saccharomycodes ludwigii]SSD62066.1 related to Autophagy-related protein 21 [Saccharomycodes ludwigii]